LSNNKNRFLIGFDRYVQLDWCAAALEVATGVKTVEQAKEEVANVLTGIDSRRKTFDILKRLWISPLPAYSNFVERGLELFKQQGQSSVAPLNWGCAMVTYPFFGHTSEITGRLIAMQGDCSIKEIQRRMAEIYGDRESVSRAVSRVLQSQENWGVLERVEDGKRLIREQAISIVNEQVALWLIEAVLRFHGKAIAAATLPSLSVLYPFSFDQSLAYIVSKSPMLELRSEGANQQFVALRGVI